MGKKSGALLFEVLLTLIILSVGLITIVRAFSLVLHTGARLNNYAQAALLLEDKLSETEAYGSVAIDTKSEGVFADDERFTWQITSHALNDIASLSEVCLAVIWQENNKEQKIEIVTYMPNETE